MTLIQKLSQYFTVILIVALLAISNQLLAVQFPADFKTDYAKAVHDTARIRILLEYSDKYGTDSITMLFADSALKLIEKNYNKGLNRKILDESATIQFDGFAEGKAQLTVYDLVGNQLLNRDMKVEVGNNEYKLDLVNYPKGVYMVRVVYNGVTRNSKLAVVQ